MKTELSILHVLVYFDLFDYPLTKKEIRLFLNSHPGDDQFEQCLNQLISEKKIWKVDDFYSLQNRPELAIRRLNGNKKAADLMERAKIISNQLYQFPYVRAIGVSGSVSKNFADENADIDYFIITKANRLWIARTMMHLFKKIPFLKGRKTLYCMNYYVDEEGLVIEEKNIYTATELVTLVPMAGNGSLNHFFEANTWACQYFPNFIIHKSEDKSTRSSWLKTFFEKLFNNRLGDRLDDYLMKLTTRRWKQKEDEHRLNTKGEYMGLQTSKHCSKPNPRFFHDSFINKFETRLSVERNKWGL